MKLSFSTLGCPGWAWDEIFATAKDLGLSGIEIRGIENEMFAPLIKCFNSKNLEKTMLRMAKSGMEIPILTSGACLGFVEYENSMNEAKAYIDFAPSVGAKYVRVMITPYPHPTDSNIEQAKKLYKELCEYAKDKNVTVLIETNGPLSDSSVMKEFVKDIDGAGVLWDVHHPYRYFGEKPEYTYANIGEWIKYVHVKDSVMSNGAASYRMMGYGDVPVFDSLQILSDNNYDGFVSLEWVKRWYPDLQEPGIVFSHFSSYMTYLLNQI